MIISHQLNGLGKEGMDTRHLYSCLSMHVLNSSEVAWERGEGRSCSSMLRTVLRLLGIKRKVAWSLHRCSSMSRTAPMFWSKRKVVRYLYSCCMQHV